jgi:hypothetical protein
MPARGDSRWKWQEAMQLRMPRGQVVSPRRRGYAGNRAARQAFFSNFLRDSAVPKNQVGGKQRPRARPPEGTNRREDNPAQIEAEERTSHRAG